MPEDVSPAFPEETVTDSTELVALQHNEDFSHNPSTKPFFVSGTITIFRSKKAMKSEVQNVTHKEAHCTPKELHDFPIDMDGNLGTVYGSGY